MPIRRRRLPSLLCLLALSPMLPAHPAAADALTLDTLMRTMAAAPSRRATFVERRRFAALTEALQSRGTLSYRPGLLEKVTTWPDSERLQVDGNRIVVTTGNEPPRVIDLGMAPDLRTFIDAIRGPLSGDAAALRRAFYCVVTGSPDAWALTLVPRDGTKLLRSVRLEGHGDAVSAIAVVQANGDSQVMDISPG